MHIFLSDLGVQQGMSDYRETRIWKLTLGEQPKDKYGEARERLRVTFRKFRDRAALLAQEIPRDLASLTVHDISHIDALWETADIIAGDEITFTPLEAFVLGGAFLIHDLGLGLAAYPNGIADLQRQPEWHDYMRGALRRFLGREPESAELSKPPDQLVQEVKFLVLRNIHAKTAEHLVSIEWQDKKSGAHFRLLDDPEIQSAFGPIIGRIAHSHWWSIEQLSKRFSNANISPPVGFPREWEIDVIKTALVLRLADIAHLDARRAPTFLKILRNPAAPSDLHWVFQERLFQVRRDGDRLVYTGKPFPQADAQAWWLCFDTLRAVDLELRHADNLNVDLHRMRFAARGVRNVEDPVRLKELIPTTGWEPIDAQVKVGHVASLVSRLGGRELYGDDRSVPLRELIQNAADAIRARRVLENRSCDWGTISLRLGKDELGGWIEIEDNGVGMSVDVLTGPFLDFGNSFWNTDAAASEFPSLIARGFQSTGRYGIGFFSVFMWGDRVHVTTRRYDQAAADTRVLEFEKGLGLRPILRPARADELIREGGTRVRIWPYKVADTRAEWVTLQDSDDPWLFPHRKADPIASAYWLCPMLDIDIYVDDGDKRKGLLIRASDWLTLTGEELLKRTITGYFGIGSLEPWGTNVRPLYHNGAVIGRGCIVPGDVNGCVTIGGCRSKTLLTIAAAIAGESARVSREEAQIRITPEELSRWATEQSTLVRFATQNPEDLAECARIIALLGGQIGDLPIAQANGVWMSSQETANWAREQESIIVITPTDAAKIQRGYQNWVFKDNVAIEPRFVEHWVKVPLYRRFHWDLDSHSKSHAQPVRRPIVRAIASGWSLVPEDLEVSSGDGFYVSDYADNIDADEIRRPGCD